MAPKIAPLTNAFMLTSIVGFLISAVVVYKLNQSYGVAFMIIFIAMFIASLISMTYTESGEELLIDKKVHRRKAK